MSITFVDNSDTFTEMLDYFETSKPDIIGMDCEWTQHNLLDDNASTFQIATRERVFIVATKSLVDLLDDNLVNRFGDLVLFSETLIKLGFEFSQDGEKLANLFPLLKPRFANFVKDVINLDKIAEKCHQKNPEILSLSNSKGVTKPSLSKLTMTCLGKPLDKRECMSNWDNKPLRQAQLNYAALDAFVLIKIHDFIQSRCKELNVNYDYTSKNQT
jgi:hypothetical protein